MSRVRYYFVAGDMRSYAGIATLPQSPCALESKLIMMERFTERYYRLFPHLRGRNTAKEWRRQQWRGESRAEWNERRAAFEKAVFWPSLREFWRDVMSNPPRGFTIEPEGAA